jgi:hypothetical protein
VVSPESREHVMDLERRRALRASVGKLLSQSYEELVAEPMPERFSALLERLELSGAHAAAGDMTSPSSASD